MQPIWQVPSADRLCNRYGLLAGNACCAVEQFLCQSDEDCVCLHIQIDGECQPAPPTVCLPSVTAAVTPPLHLCRWFFFLLCCCCWSPCSRPLSFTHFLSLLRPSLLFLSPYICVFSIRVMQALRALAPLITVTATTAWQDKTHSTAGAGY